MVNDAPPLVVKIGGSLLEYIPDLISELVGSGLNLLLVPGGGFLADKVRKMDLDDDSAHWMAVAAMEQMGWYISSKGVMATDRLIVPRNVLVLLPYLEMRTHDPLPHSWDITSDTIAAWVAKELDLDLLILKSVDGITQNGKLCEEIAEPFSCEEVDPEFLHYTLKNDVKATIVNGRDMGRVSAFLNGSRVRGTVIHTRL
jgi:aspartokinase-like uncharacterized kinase